MNVPSPHHSNRRRQFSALCAIMTGGVLVLTGCNLLPPTVNPRTHEFTEIANETATLCAETPSLEDLKAIVSRSWYRNEFSPKADTLLSTADAFHEACQIGGVKLDHWLTDEDLDKARAARLDARTHAKALRANYDDAMTFWEFSYASLQFGFAYARFRQLYRGLAGLTAEDTALFEELSHFYESLTLLTDYGNPKAEELSETILDIRGRVARIRNYLMTRDPEFGPPLAQGLEAVQPSVDNPLHATMFPPMLPEEMPSISMSMADLANNPPQAVLSSPLVSVSAVGESDMLRFAYMVEDQYVKFGNIADPWERIVITNGVPFGVDGFPRHTGIGNEVCISSKDSRTDCYLQSTDGRWWVAEVPPISAASSRGILGGWLKLIAN